jgi:hypothetical protein|tara:strand:- start:267 stop:641 length:375 start_codon:yes stop_codon:yes gene_type:complete
LRELKDHNVIHRNPYNSIDIDEVKKSPYKPMENPKYKLYKSSIENSIVTNTLNKTYGYNTVVNSTGHSRGNSASNNEDMKWLGRRKSEADVSNCSKIFRNSQIVLGDAKQSYFEVNREPEKKIP